MKAPSSLPKLIAVVGPTASGKTDLAIGLARRFRGEIVSADSRQLYRGTEIGSATVAGRRAVVGGRRALVARGVAHHLLGILPPSVTLTSAGYKDKAIRALRGIIARGKVPFLVGGTGLYVRAVVDNFAIPEVPPDPALRRRLEAKTTPALYALLRRRDPAYAGRIPPGNRRYAIRALEVIEKTGRPFSEAQGRGAPLFDTLTIGVRRPREALYHGIDRRVDAMMAAGLLAEAKRLGRRYGWHVPAMSGIGHRQLGMYLRGEIDLPEAVRLIKRDTRRYAKRQMTWFRREPAVRWVKNEAEARLLVAAFLGR